MKRLSLSRGPRWVEIDHELSVLLRPMLRVELLALLAEDPATIPADGDLRAAAAGAKAGVAAAVRLALAAVEDWTVADTETGERLPVSEPVARALFDDLALAGLFAERVTAEILGPADAVAAEGNGSAPLPNGSSAGAPTTAPTVPAPAPSAPGA